MLKTILASATAALIVSSIALPAQAMHIFNGAEMNGLSVNGTKVNDRTLNGATHNGTDAGRGFAIEGIELPAAN